MPGWSQFVDLIANVLTVFHGYVGSYGLAIVLFTVAIKLVTWPLTSTQIRSSRAMAEMQPKIKELQAKYKDDKERQTQEMMKLYQELGVNPLSGCLPLVIQMPIWIALYQSIRQLASQNLLNEAFLFLPSLACPGANTELCGPAAQGIGWVVDVANLGQTWPYLILPILTVGTQLLMTRVLTPQRAQATSAKAGATEQDSTAAMMNQMNMIMPIMFGYFALTYPAGLALYWVTNNVLTFAQYMILNRLHAPRPAATLAAATSSGGTVEVEVAPQNYQESGGGNDKAGRKRKKR